MWRYRWNPRLCSIPSCPSQSSGSSPSPPPISFSPEKQAPSCWVAAVETQVCPLETGWVASSPSSLHLVSLKPHPHPHQCASAPVLCGSSISWWRGWLSLGNHPLKTGHGLCTHVQMEGILLCSPEVIMSHPLLDSCHQSQGLRWGKQSRSALSLDIYLPGFQRVHSTRTSLQLSCGPLATEVPPPHQGPYRFLVPGDSSIVSPLAPEVGPYPAAHPHPSPSVRKGSCDGPGTNATPGEF